jgi:Zn finger protein HypA/HybF involved in hydrogenase expression
MMMEMRLLWLRVGVLRNISLETVDVSLQVCTCNTSAEKILLSIWNMGFMAPKSVQYWNIVWYHNTSVL